MSRRFKLLLAVLIALGGLALGVGLYGVLTQDDTAAAPTEASLIPAFTPGAAPAVVGTTITGKRFDLADLEGTPVILNFWASWCGPCRREIPAIATWAAQHPEVQVVGVDYQDSAAEARAFATAHGATWPSVIDDGAIGAAYKVPGLPATFLIDRQGQLVGRLLGEVTTQQLDESLKALTA